MKLTSRHLLILGAILLLSICFGVAFDAVATAMERSAHPRPEHLEESVTARTREFGVPEPIVWALLCVGSDFASNAVSEDGAVGLMQLTPAQFTHIFNDILKKEVPDTGLLYDPETNLLCGVAYLSHLYERYGVWDLTLAAYRAGSDTVDAWLADPQYTNGQGILKKIPNAEVSAFVKNVTKAADLYRELYYEP